MLIRRFIRLCLFAWVLMIPATAVFAAPPTKDVLEKKLGLVEYYLKSPTARRVQESDNSSAKELMDRARALHARARDLIDAGNLQVAEESISQALRAISGATTTLTKGGASANELRKRNDGLRSEIASYRKSYMTTLQERGPAAANLLDLQRLDELLGRAEELSRKNDHGGARKLLDDAYHMTVTAVTRLRNNETVVYTLNFRTPADEFRYESDRNRSYTMLVQQMKSAGRAEGSAEKLVEKFVNEGKRLHDAARNQAESGDYEAAIKTMEDANKNLVRALQMMGLAIPG